MLHAPDLKKIFRIRVYAQLNDFLPREKRQREFEATFKSPINVQEILLALGLPLSEVYWVSVNGRETPFSHFPKENDRIAIFPEWVNIPLSDLPKAENNETATFILDAHLGKLAKYLRMLGFDTLYSNHFKDEEIISTAAGSRRIILTRDKALLASPQIGRGYYIRAIHPHAQLQEVVRYFNLFHQFSSFTRCMTCNSQLEKIEKKDCLSKIPETVSKVFDDFYHCPTCDNLERLPF